MEDFSPNALTGTALIVDAMTPCASGGTAASYMFEVRSRVSVASGDGKSKGRHLTCLSGIYNDFADSY